MLKSTIHMNPIYPKALFLVLPEQFTLAEQSAIDNRYMSDGQVDADKALQQSLSLAAALRLQGQTVLLFPGDANAPDGVFPNNVFATTSTRVIIGNMRHDVRRQEAKRDDLRQYFCDLLARELHDLSAQLPASDAAELTGSIVIDRARNIGFCGLGERCTAKGAAAMGTAFALDQVHSFALADGEYHANVIMSALGGRGLLLCGEGFANPDDANRVAALYPPEQVIWISRAEKQQFVGNCIALGGDQLWMSARAEAAMTTATRTAIAKLGLQVCSVDLSELEKAGGSLRCMIGEIY